MNTIDWNAARAEYIAGGISQRALAEKLGVSRFSVQQRARRENWAGKRKEAQAEYTKRAIQETADAAADNAAIAERIRTKLLQKLEQIVDAIAEYTATEYIECITEGTNKTTKKFRFVDLTGAYRDLATDMRTESGGVNELLQSLLDMERRK